MAVTDHQSHRWVLKARERNIAYLSVSHRNSGRCNFENFYFAHNICQTFLYKGINNYVQHDVYKNWNFQCSLFDYGRITVTSQKDYKYEKCLNQ